jgi:hypothetical protein
MAHSIHFMSGHRFPSRRCNERRERGQSGQSKRPSASCPSSQNFLVRWRNNVLGRAKIARVITAVPRPINPQSVQNGQYPKLNHAPYFADRVSSKSRSVRSARLCRRLLFALAQKAESCDCRLSKTIIGVLKIWQQFSQAQNWKYDVGAAMSSHA